VQMRADQKLESAQRALGFFDGHYQTGARPASKASASTATLHAGT
jgi:hypothetical protein